MCNTTTLLDRQGRHTNQKIENEKTIRSAQQKQRSTGTYLHGSSSILLVEQVPYSSIRTHCMYTYVRTRYTNFQHSVIVATYGTRVVHSRLRSIKIKNIIIQLNSQ